MKEPSDEAVGYSAVAVLVAVLPFAAVLVWFLWQVLPPDQTPACVSTEYQRSVWPPPPPEEAEFEVADNLLAKNYYVILDGSGSMSSRGCSGSETKSVASKRALQRFSEVVPADAN